MKNMYLNLTQMLQGCSKRNGMTVRASNPDGEPTVNRQSRLMSLSGKKAEKEQLSPSCLLSASFPLSFRSRYLRYAAVIFCVLALSIGQAWGQTTWVKLDSIDFTNTTNFPAQDISGTDKGTTTKTISGVFFTAKKSKTINLNNTTPGVVFNDNGDLTHAVAIPVTGVNEELKIIVYHNYNNTSASFKTAITHSTNNDPSESQTTDLAMGNSGTKNKNDYVQIKTELTGSSYIVWATRAGASYTTIKSIAIYTKEAAAAKDFTVTATVSGGVGGTVSAAASSLDATETTTITATPATGYQVTNWAVSGTGASISPSGASNSNTTTLTMGTANATVTATFGLIDYSVSKTLTNCAVKAGSSAIPSTMHYGDDLSTIIEPTTGNLLPGSITVSGVTSYTWNALTGALTLTDVTGAVSVSISAAAPQTGSGASVTYALVTSGSTAATYSTGVFSNILSGGSSNKNTLVASNTLSGGNGVAVQSDKNTPKSSRTAGITSSTGDFSAGSSPYAEFTFDVVDGYTFTPTAISVPVMPITYDAYFTAIVTDGSSTWTSATSKCTQGAQATINATPAGGSALTGTVNIRVFCHNQETAAKGFRFGTGSVTITGTVAAAAPSCTDPDHVGIDGSWRYFPGQTISLTATGYDGSDEEVVATAYQWQKEVSADNWSNLSNGTAAGVTISGATSSNLQISNCGTGNTGNYRCIVSTGATCSTTSDPFSVKIFTMNGAYDDGEFSSNNITLTSGTTGTATVHLAAGRVYKFKVTDNFGMWFGNSGRILEPAVNWDFSSGEDDNCVLFTGPEGDYTFTVDIDHVTYGTPEVVVSVAYPDVTHPSAGYAYFKNVDNWTNVGLYMWYEGGGSYTDWGSEPWVTRTTTICGDTYYYTPLPSWYNRAIFREVGGSGQTGDIEYANLAAYSGKYNDKSDANWHDFTTYTISFNAGGGTGTMSSITDICPGADKVLPANTFEKTGYTFAGWKDASDNEYADEATIEDISDDITLTAQWEVAASLTAISADVLYQAADMANITFTGSDQNFTGLSNNHLFKVYGTDGNAAKGKTVSSTSITDDIGSKSFTSLAYIMPADNLSSESDPTKGAIEIITPSTAGLLYVYTNNASTNLKLKKKGQNSTTALSGAKYKAVAVEANTHYFIVNDGGKGDREIYGIQYVSTYGVTITPTYVTKETGDTGAGAAIKGKAYTATFTANTGYTLPSDVTVTIGGTPATKGTEYTWTVSSGTGTLTVLAANVTGAINILVVGSAPAGHTVTYNYNGATGGAGTPSATGASVTLPNPTRTDYTFDGWYKTDGTKVSSPYTPTADITLYARWEEACDAGSGEEGATKIIGFTTATCSQKASTGGERTLSNVSNLTVAHEIHDGGDGDDSLIVYTSADQNMYYGSTTKVYSRGGYRWIKGNSTLGNNTVGFSATVASGYQFTIDSISFGIGGTANFTYQVIIYQSDTLYKSPIRSVTNYSANTSANHEFHVNGLSAQTKLQNLTGTFYVRVRVCQSSTGKYFYLPVFQVIGNLHESGGGGGGIGTCYHVYYKGNGADEGFVADTTSYADGEEVTVLDYDNSRYPLAKDDYEFRGWATSAGGSVAYSAGDKITIDGANVTLHAVWVAESDALVTWKMKTADNEAWATTTGTGTTDETNITSISTAHDEGDDKAKNPATAKTAMASGEVSSTAAPDKSARFTFTIAGGKQVEINKFDCKVYNVSSGNRTYKAQISDAAGNVYNSTNKVAVSAEATLTDASFVFGSGKILRGAVTIRIYAWKTSGSPTEFRMGPDVEFYGTVENYACATPDAPTISGVSEYVPGQTITLTASHDGENYDDLTTYTWYKGEDWATASDNTPVQAAVTGESGYTLTIDDCTTDNAGLYWCKVSNGTGCDAHNSEGYDVTVYPTYTITYNLNGGNELDGTQKTTYTQMDEDYTLPTPTKTGFVFAGWYGASDFSGLPTVVLGSGSVGNKEYWAKWGATVTVSWTVTKVDDKLYRGGGGYSVKAVINETTWNESYKDQLELTATEGVTLKNIEVSENDESKVQVTADFDITTGLAADATEITFTLDVPADGTYGPKVDEHEEALTSCAGSSTTITIFDGATMSDKTDADDISYKSGTEYTDGTTGFKYKCANFKKDLVDVTGYTNHGSYSNAMKYGGNSTSYYISMTIPTGYTGSMEIVYGSTDKTKYFAFGTSNSSAANGSNGTKWNATTAAATTLYSATIDDLAAGTYYLLATGDKAIVAKIAMTLYATGGGITPTLTWDDGDADIATTGIAKNTSDNDFIYTARQNKNSLGAITYSSSDATVATVNATTGQVHLVGAAGTATITATIAASGCFSSANVSYTITVTDDCDDEAGTIETEDLGCSGVKMTVTGHTAAAGVSYQWYKVGTSSDATVGTGQDNFTATEAGSYYVIVTNTGNRHCAKRSTNTITVEAQAVATATKIVDSWYVKNGRRTPDIELVKTTNATSFTVTSGSITIWESAGSTKTGFGGCGFHMDENGIIYLNGTKDDDGSATTGLTAGDETLTITAIGCGGNASQNITIHKQAATTYKEIAFVADGGKGMRKDSITVGHGDGTELYEYLDSVGTAAGKRLFQLSERNIYWTTDEKAIREEYSQFDAILITDDPSTNTVVKTGDDYKTKGYVNAFGTMVDVRPIFTMEAYVSALKNWKTKGIAGAPESPNPRQYEMRLECKDHEIYDAGLPEPSDGTNVWEETIGGETFRHVILVDSTKGVYKGVAYNAQTAGKEKPALQGFTSEAAGSLLGLGRILEGTLQAAIERQEEPAARLLVMGINAKALQPTCALTNEGKAVIKNILVYLLKTNMEEVDDCSNYFTGGASGTDTDWNKASNWSKKALPSNEVKVRILAPCVITDGTIARVSQIDIAVGGKSTKKAGEINGSLTVNAGGSLIVGGKIRRAEAPNFGVENLKPTEAADLVLKTSSSAQAALIFDNEDGDTKATVELYSLGRKEGGHYQFQYYAVPMDYVSVSESFAGSDIYTYVWHEATGWERRGYYTDLYAFEGVGITTKLATPKTYTMKGALASTATKEITLTKDDDGYNLIGNSWTAPIQISQLEEDNGSLSNKTVYIYNAGNDTTAEEGTGTGAGQWQAIPFAASGFSGWSGMKVIPAMQAFELVPTSEETLTLDYEKVVRGDNKSLTEPLHAPRRVADHAGIELMRIRVADSQTRTDLHLFEGERFSDEFDNGWEAAYMDGDDGTTKLYADVALGRMAVVATDELEGTLLGFAPGKETEYTFTFGGEGMGYYLNDLKLKTSTLISEEATYSFTYEEDDTNRFYISRTPIDAPQTPTGVENTHSGTVKAHKFIYNDKLYIMLNGRVYSAEGQIVK